MKWIRIFGGLSIVALLVFSSGSQISSCTKTNNIYDTIIKTVHDTTVKTVHDTAFIYDLQDGLVAYYTFNNGSISDSTPFHNNISFNNATAVADRFGHPNSAYSFDGATTYMTVPNSPSLNPSSITIFAIVKINGFNNSLCHINQILGKGSPDVINGFYSLRFDDWPTTCVSAADTSNEFFYGQFGDNNPQGSTSGASSDSVKIREAQWYVITYTYDGLYSKLYINGVLKDQKMKTAAFGPNSDPIYIGKHGDPPYPYYLNGIIDEIRIYNHALPEAAVMQLSSLQH